MKNPKVQKPVAKVFSPEEIAEFEAAKQTEMKERAETCLKEWQIATDAILKKYNCRTGFEAHILDDKSNIGIYIISN